MLKKRRSYTAKLREAISEVTRMSTRRALANTSQPTIASELEGFLNDARQRRGLSENTITSYHCDLRAASMSLTMPLGQIATVDIEAFLNERQEKASTTNRRVASLNRFFLWAMRQNLCEVNPVALIETKRDDEHLPRPIRSAAELKALDSGVAHLPQPYRLIFTILRETGMRADEVLSLNVGDVSLEVGREGLHIFQAKNRTDRVVVLTSDIMPKSIRGLRAWLREDGQGSSPHTPLFRSNRGTRVAYDTLHYHWGQLCEATGLVDVVEGKQQPRYTIHQLRHTVGSQLITQYPEQIVSRMLGHRDPRSTRRYAEVTEDQVRAVLAQRRK